MSDSFSKSIELRVRQLFNRWFRSDRVPVVVATPTDILGLGETARILVLRQDRIGDVLISTPIVRALRKRYPQARIDALLSGNNFGAKRAYEPFVDEFLRYSKSVVGITRLRAQMRANNYDVVVDMTDNASSTSSMLISMSNARYAVGIDKENRGVYTHVVPRVPRDSMHIVERIVRLLWPFGIDSESVDKRMEYRISEAERSESLMLPQPPDRIRIGVNISGSNPSRRLDAAMMTDFIESVKRTTSQIDFYIFTTSDLIDLQKQVCAATGVFAVPASTSFHAYACALSCMHAIVTPDTAAVHLAAAWQMPSVVLYQPEVPAVFPWYPYGSYSIACVSDGETIRAITAETVAEAILRMVRETGLTPSA